MPRSPQPPEIDPETEELDQLLGIALSRIRRDEHDPDGYLRWFQDCAPVVAPTLFQTMHEDARASAAYWMGVGIWNATPLASHRYRPRPLPLPERNRPCPCGSGHKFKHCCLPLAREFPVDVDWVWSRLVEIVPEKTWLAESKQGHLPIEARLHLAAYFEESGRWRALVRLLEPDLVHAATRLDPRFGGVVDALCNAYDALYRTDRKKRDLLLHLAGHPVARIRAAANQRLAAWLADEGEDEQAWQALREAMRADPDDPGSALLELNLLYGRGELDRIKQRAEFWFRRMARHTDAPPALVALLDDMRKDPAAAFEAIQAAQTDPELAELVADITAAIARRLPTYTWQPIGNADDAQTRGWCELVADDATARVGLAWSALCPVGKPFSTEWLPREIDDAWQDDRPWRAFLHETPVAYDSLDVLDDVVTLILIHPDGDLPWVERAAVRPLLQRALAIVDAARREGLADSTLPWLLERNRPALRLVSRLVSIGTADLTLDTEVSLMRRYLALNPNDNHGWRGPFVNLLLHQGRDSEALAVMERYPDDTMADTAFGRVLALFRTGEKGRATLALADARDHLPVVFEYLLQDSVAQPRMSPGRYTVGGKDEAWLYREAMRDVWVATPGLLELMRALPKRR